MGEKDAGGLGDLVAIGIGISIPAAFISAATWFLINRVADVENSVLTTQYTPKPDGTFSAKNPNMIGRYCKICCVAAADSSASGLGGGWRSFWDTDWMTMSINGRLRKQRVSCQPSEGTPSTQFWKSHSDVCDPYTGLAKAKRVNGMG